MFASLNGTTTTRCGLSVSKKNGGAVIRNKIKRRLREAFRHERSALPEGLDLILIPKNNVQSSVQDYRNALRLLVEKLNTRLRGANSQPPRDSV